METQVKEGVIFSLSFQEALDRATSLISGYKAKPLLIGSLATLSPLFSYKVTLEYDFPNDKRKRTLTATIFVDPNGNEVKVKGDIQYSMPFQVEMVEGKPPSDEVILQVAKKELPSTAEVINSRIDEVKKAWYTSSFTFTFSLGLTNAHVKVGNTTQVTIDPIKREAIVNLLKKEFGVEGGNVEIKEREEGYTLTYLDENWNGFMELNKVGVVLSKELKITQKHAVSLVEQKVNGKALLVTGEFRVYAEDDTTLYRCDVDPHTGDVSCKRVGIPSGKVKENSETYFINNMFSRPTTLDVSFTEEGWIVKISGETGVAEYLVKHDGSSIKVKFLRVNEKFGEMWGKKEFPGCEVKSSIKENSIEVNASDGNFNHRVILSLEGKVKEKEHSITDSYALRLAYNTMGLSSGCREELKRWKGYILVDLSCNGKHHIVKLENDGKVKETLDAVDITSLLGSLKLGNVVSAGYKDKNIVVKVEEEKHYRYIKFNIQGEKLKEEICDRGFLSKIKCVKQDLEYRPSTQDPTELIMS